jgi:hypothetical protein
MEIMTDKKSTPLIVAGAWIVVLIPLCWGVVQTAIKSLPLFQTQRPSVTSLESK